MAQMKAVRIHRYGGTDTLTYEDAPRPVPADGEVLIRVQATSINPFDAVVRAGYVSKFMPLPFPITLGRDISGVIEEVGPGVSGLQIGKQVYAYAEGNGAYAEYAVVSASAVAAYPESIDAVHAAVIPNVMLAAWQGLFEQAKLTEGQSILIHGAAGGVGHSAAQLAKWRGAVVIGTASNNLDFLKELNVDQAIDYSATSFEDEVSGLDVIFDTVGGDTYERSARLLKPGGVLVSTVRPMQGGPSEDIASTYDVRQEMIIGRPPVEKTLREIAGLVDAGYIKPHVSKVLPLREASKAHELIESRHTRGKIALKVA